MKRAIILTLAMLVLGMSNVLATWGGDSGSYVLTDFSGAFQTQHAAVGGWYYDNGWALEEYQHPTAIVGKGASTTGVMTYIESYLGSGTEASGTAWKLSTQSTLQSTAGATYTSINAWTVNTVPPGSAYTTIHMTEEVVKEGYVHSISLSGAATGMASILSSYSSPDDYFQTTHVGINMP